MPDPDDIELVHRAILSRTTGDCRWKESLEAIVRSDRSMMGLTPEAITARLRDYIGRGGELIAERIPFRRGIRRITGIESLSPSKGLRTDSSSK